MEELSSYLVPTDDVLIPTYMLGPVLDTEKYNNLETDIVSSFIEQAS